MNNKLPRTLRNATRLMGVAQGQEQMGKFLPAVGQEMIARQQDNIVNGFRASSTDVRIDAARMVLDQLFGPGAPSAVVPNSSATMGAASSQGGDKQGGEPTPFNPGSPGTAQ